jgi:hypothetical protein
MPRSERGLDAARSVVPALKAPAEIYDVVDDELLMR